MPLLSHCILLLCSLLSCHSVTCWLTNRYRHVTPTEIWWPVFGEPQCLVITEWFQIQDTVSGAHRTNVKYTPHLLKCLSPTTIHISYFCM
jgi:hypothetical protein